MGENKEYEGKSLEEVKEYRYLRYMMKVNGKQEVHINERIRRKAILLRQVWGIGKRILYNLRKRLWLFDRLI